MTGAAYTQLIWNPGSALKPTCRELEGIREKLAVVERQIAEIRAQEKPTTGNPGLFGQQFTSHPGLRALQDRKRQLERVVEQLEGELP